MSLYDSVNADNEPDGPGDYGAGYDDGRYANWMQVQARFGTRAVIDVTVAAGDDEGNCLDVENGDATAGQAPGWTVKARARHVDPVWNYCNLSTWPDLIRAYLAAGVALPDRWWIAHYTGQPHFPQVVVDGVTYTADACQYSGGMTARFDTSCFRPGAFTANQTSPTPPSAPAPVSSTHGGNMLAFDPVTGGTWAVRPDGSVFAADGAPYLGGLNIHPDWNAGAGKPLGPAVGIAPYGPGGQGGYEILCDNGTGPQPARYRFPRDGSQAKPT